MRKEKEINNYDIKMPKQKDHSLATEKENNSREISSCYFYFYFVFVSLFRFIVQIQFFRSSQFHQKLLFVANYTGISKISLFIIFL